MMRVEEPQEPPPPPPPRESLLTVGTVKTIFDASWKLLPLLWFAFQFYSNQATVAEKVDSNRKVIEKLQTDYNELNRKVTTTAVMVEGMKQIQDNDRQFFLETHPARARR